MWWLLFGHSQFSFNFNLPPLSVSLARSIVSTFHYSPAVANVFCHLHLLVLYVICWLVLCCHCLHCATECTVFLPRHCRIGVDCQQAVHLVGHPRLASGTHVLSSAWLRQKLCLLNLPPMPTYISCCIVLPTRTPKQRRQSMEHTDGRGKVNLTKVQPMTPEALKMLSQPLYFECIRFWLN